MVILRHRYVTHFEIHSAAGGMVLLATPHISSSLTSDVLKRCTFNTGVELDWVGISVIRVVYDRRGLEYGRVLDNCQVKGVAAAHPDPQTLAKYAKTDAKKPNRCQIQVRQKRYAKPVQFLQKGKGCGIAAWSEQWGIGSWKARWQWPRGLMRKGGWGSRERRGSGFCLSKAGASKAGLETVKGESY
ncbi:hypothetical protein FA15DRAFT_659722 [Coprinopsis marcescibilis]|uniref:Uncharacterized protein n=1 Tax=Coprinopsis marcescibilis TaxID=230819 RepID=A0A5C3KIE5_COPMA|nr:hypothetical protein FA15DRAFT_659722 [Coprinopsis marcescibilis]